MRARYYLEFKHLPLTQMLLGNSFHPGGKVLTRELAKKTNIHSNSIVLDLGAGQCNSSHYVAEYFDAQVYAIDIQHQYLLNSRQLKTKVKPKTNSSVHLLQGDVHHLPVASNSIDVVICECVLGSFANREQVLAEAYRVLKPEGYLAISDIYVNEIMPIEVNVELNRWLRVNNAYNSIRCQEVIQQGGFHNIKFKDASVHLLETIHTIETKLTKPDPKLHALIRKDNIEQQSIWQHGIPRQLSQFIYDGGAGYYTLTAQKPLI